MPYSLPGNFNDGTQFDSSSTVEPLEFVCGAGQMIKGFDAAAADMEVGQIVDIHLMPEEAYGMPDPEAIFTLEIAQLPGSENLEVGQQVYLSNQYGQPFPVKVLEKEERRSLLMQNHEMAGKELNFKIELVEGNKKWITLEKVKRDRFRWMNVENPNTGEGLFLCIEN